MHPTNNGSTEDVQPLVVPTESPILACEPVNSPIIEPVAFPYPSRLHDQELRDKANDQREKIFQIFEDLNFNISFADALILMPNLTPYYDPIVSTTSLTLTPFGNSDFFLEEVDAFLALKDDPTSLEFDQSYLDSEGDILLLEAFLSDDKFPVIIAKDLSVAEKTALITVLKSHKRAIAWKLSDINGIDPEFCTHKILMKEDFEPAVQHQRRVNPK
nr:reverse transcriptase domain-containing protein [Tanacetum cinerariifolium]